MCHFRIYSYKISFNFVPFSPQESESDETLPALNLLICLVARYLDCTSNTTHRSLCAYGQQLLLSCRYFEQNDLADQPQ